MFELKKIDINEDNFQKYISKDNVYVVKRTRKYNGKEDKSFMGLSFKSYCSKFSIVELFEIFSNKDCCVVEVIESEDK